MIKKSECFDQEDYPYAVHKLYYIMHACVAMKQQCASVASVSLLLRHTQSILCGLLVCGLYTSECCYCWSYDCTKVLNTYIGLHVIPSSHQPTAAWKDPKVDQNNKQTPPQLHLRLASRCRSTVVIAPWLPGRVSVDGFSIDVPHFVSPSSNQSQFWPRVLAEEWAVHRWKRK